MGQFEAMIEGPGRSADTKNPHPADGREGLESIESADLFGGRNELIIEHNGECYRLRITSNGKLILTQVASETMSVASNCAHSWRPWPSPSCPRGRVG